MKQTTRQLLLVTGFGVVLYVTLSHLDAIRSFLLWTWDLLLPITIGAVLAFFLNVPATGIERRLTGLCAKSRRKALSPGAIRGVSVFLTLILVVLILVLTGVLLIPTLVSSVSNIAELAGEKLPQWLAQLERLGLDVSQLNEKLLEFGKTHVLQNFVNYSGGLLSGAFSAATAAVGLVGTFLIALVLAVYLLTGKEMLIRQGKKLLYAYLKPSAAEGVCRLGRLIASTYAHFLSGQCLESVILGLLIFVSFSLFQLPYAGLVAVLTAVCAFIPYVGAFLSCGVAALLTLLIDPFQALMAIIVYQVVQFIEGQFIYPRVVGTSVGLPALWTLVAVVLGGKLFGVLGMIFFIPAAAVIYALLRGSANRRLRQNGVEL